MPGLNPPANGWPPPDGPCTERESVYPLGEVRAGWEGQIVDRESRVERTGRLVGFAVMLQLQEMQGTGWYDVVRIDTAHGFVHIDRYDQRGNQTKLSGVPPNCVSDPDAGHSWALDYVFEMDGWIEEWA